MKKIIPIILCGGAGKRLWPLSSEASPKQFLRFDSDHNLFQEAVLRVNNADYFTSPLIVGSKKHRSTCLSYLFS